MAGIVAIALQLITLSREPSRQRDDTADELLRETAQILKVLATEAPDGLTVAIIEIEIDRLDNRGRVGVQVHIFEVEARGNRLVDSLI